jgi:hypothetical protein
LNTHFGRILKPLRQLIKTMQGKHQSLACIVMGKSTSWAAIRRPEAGPGAHAETDAPLVFVGSFHVEDDYKDRESSVQPTEKSPQQAETKKARVG